MLIKDLVKDHHFIRNTKVDILNTQCFKALLHGSATPTGNYAYMIAFLYSKL